MIAQFGFDTLSFVKRLSAAGMDTGQAEALAEALTAHAFDELATKADLKELRAELKTEMKELELRLTMRMGAMSAASTALTVAILGALITLS
jgi:molybdopterin synthase catalytic subunit